MSDPMILGFGLLWALQSLGQCALITYYLYFSRKKGEKEGAFDHSLLYVLMVMEFFEGTAFILYSGNNSQPNPDYTWGAVFNVWQLINAGNLWCFAFGLVMHGKEFNIRIWWPCCLLGSTMAAILYIILAVLTNSTTTGFLFLAVFEPPQYIMLSAMVGIGGTYGGDKGIWALGLFGGFLVVALAHLYSIMALFDPNYSTPLQFPITRALSVFGSLVSNYSFYKLVRYGVFTKGAPQDPVDPASSLIYNRLPQDPAKQALTPSKGWKAYYIQPETLFSINPLWQFTGYCFCALVIFGYVKPNWLIDPIYRLYATLHPCVLLDYIPANFVAMPTFTTATMFAVTAVWMTFLRSVLLGDGFVSIVSALVLGYFFLSSCCFVLVFVFPPRISTLGHSLFYMIARSAEGLFMACMGFVVMYRGSTYPGVTFRQKQYFIMYVIGSCCLVLYGLVFMGQRLLDQAAGRWNPPVDTEIHIDPAPEIGAIVVIVVSFAYRFISPLTKFPLMFHLFSRQERWLDESQLNIETPIPEWGFFGQRVSAKVYVRRPLAVAAFFLLLSMAVAWWINTAQWTSEVVGTWTLRVFMSSLPGSAVVAVLLVPAQICTLYHVLLTIEHEMSHNDNACLRWTSVVLGPFLVATMLCASCDTTPNVPDYWKGAQAFEGMLCLWMFYHILLGLQNVCRRDNAATNKESTKGAIELKDMDSKDNKAAPTTTPTAPGTKLSPKYEKMWHYTVIIMDIVCAIMTIVFLIACMGNLNAKYAVVWILSLQAWAFFDARLVVCHFVNITVVMQTEADKYAPWTKAQAKKELDAEAAATPKAEPAKEEKKTETAESKS